MKFNQMLNQSFNLLDSKRNRLFLILFLLVYIVFFLNIFVPFHINDWMPESNVSQFLILSSYGVIGALAISFTQFLLRKWLKMEQFLLKQFLVWVFFELIFSTVLLTFIYGNDSELSNFYSDFLFSLKHTFLVIVIPYSLVLLILSLFKSKSELVEMKKENKKVELVDELVNFPDDKGNTKFTMPLNDILYLESTDNYVYIYYISQDKLKKELLRNSLKNLELILKEKPIKRCHRSYMVNLRQLNLVKKTGQKIVIKLNNVADPIPVSKTYYQEFSNYLQLNN